MRIIAELFAEKMAAVYDNTQLTINGSDEPSSVSYEETASASADEPASAAHAEPVSIYSKEHTYCLCRTAPIPNAEPTAIPDEEPAPLTKVSRKEKKFILLSMHTSAKLLAFLMFFYF